MSKKISRVLKILKNTVNVNGNFLSSQLAKLILLRRKIHKSVIKCCGRVRTAAVLKRYFSLNCEGFFLVWCIKT